MRNLGGGFVRRADDGDDGRWFFGNLFVVKVRALAQEAASRSSTARDPVAVLAGCMPLNAANAGSIAAQQGMQRLAGGVNRIPAATVFLNVSGNRERVIYGALRVPGQGGGG